MPTVIDSVEILAECPLCGHQARIIYIGLEKEVYCPDRFCPNCQDKTNE